MRHTPWFALFLMACDAGSAASDTGAAPDVPGLDAPALPTDAPGLDARFDTGPETMADTASAPDAPAAERVRPFADSSPWNTPIPADATWHDEAVLHTNPDLATGDPSDTFMHWWVSPNVSVFTSQPTDPLWTIELPDHRGRTGMTWTIRAPAEMDASPLSPDRTVILLEGTMAWDLWQFQRTGAMTARPVAWGRDDIVTGSGWGVGDGLTSGLNAGVRACNASWLAGLITRRDVISGSIDHALAVALTGQMLMAAMVPPANFYDNAGTNVGPIPSGARIGIPAGTPEPAGLSPLGRMLFAAITRYGMFVVDFIGGAWPSFYTDTSFTQAEIEPVYAFWTRPDRQGDMERIGPLLRVVDFPEPTR